MYQSGNRPVVGFIAQEVKEILPEAVMERKDYIPNIYQIATITDNILRFETNLSLSIITNASGGKIKIFDTLNKEYFIDISSATSNTLTMSDVSQLNEVEFYESNKVFVFGEEVADFHNLKKLHKLIRFQYYFLHLDIPYIFLYAYYILLFLLFFLLFSFCKTTL